MEVIVEKLFGGLFVTPIWNKFKIKNGLPDQTMSELNDMQNIHIQYNLRSQADLSYGAVYKTNYGLRSLRYFAPKNWNIIPADIKNVNNLSDFTFKIKFWLPEYCPCDLC